MDYYAAYILKQDEMKRERVRVEYYVTGQRYGKEYVNGKEEIDRISQYCKKL